MIENYNNQHKMNLMKSAGLLENNSCKYEYIQTWDQLVDAALNPQNDLGYPLRKEPKRDRVIVNSKALREAINYATDKALKDFEHSLFVFLQNEVNPLIERSAYSIFSEVMALGSPQSSSKSEDFAYKLGATFGIALGNAISDITEDIIFGNKNR